MPTTIHLSGPADVLTVLPYQLGFHPRDCLVAVSLHGTRMGLVQRLDLPPPEHVGDAVAAMIAPLRQDFPKAVLLIGFEECEGNSRAMLDEMADACRAEGVDVADRMVVRAGRWFAPDCHQSCCPPEGLLLPAPGDVPAVAEFVGREICPLPDRSALAALLEPSRPVSGEVAFLAGERVGLRLAAVNEDRVHELRAGDPDDSCASKLHDFRASELAVWSLVLSDEDTARSTLDLRSQDLAVLAVSLTDVVLRDGLIAWLCPGSLPQEMIDPGLFIQMGQTLAGPSWSDKHREDIDGGDVEHVIGLQRIERRLCELCAALPDEWSVPALTMLASFTWWRGDGALTRIALDRALRVDPDYRLAQLLERMVDLAIRPVRASA